MEDDTDKPKRRELTEYEKECAARADALRRAKRLSQEELGARMGMTQGSVSQYMTGKIPMGAAFLSAVAKELGAAPSVIDPKREILDAYTLEEDEFISVLRSANPELRSAAIRAALAVLDH